MWEVWELARRTILTGWLLLIDVEESFLRLVAGLIVCLLSFMLLMIVQPYKLWSDHQVALVSQMALIFLFIGAIIFDQYQTIASFAGNAVASTIIGISSSDEIISSMIILTFGMLVLLFVLFCVQSHLERIIIERENSYSVCTLHPPTYPWQLGGEYAAFLSHYKLVRTLAGSHACCTP